MKGSCSVLRLYTSRSAWSPPAFSGLRMLWYLRFKHFKVSLKCFCWWELASELLLLRYISWKLRLQLELVLSMNIFKLPPTNFVTDTRMPKNVPDHQGCGSHLNKEVYTVSAWPFVYNIQLHFLSFFLLCINKLTTYAASYNEVRINKISDASYLYLITL